MRSFAAFKAACSRPQLGRLDSVAYGDEPRGQQQVVPLSAAPSIPIPMPAAAPSTSAAALEAVRDYQDLVRREVEGSYEAGGSGKPSKPVIRKTNAVHS
jgi:hypothetical protein